MLLTLSKLAEKIILTRVKEEVTEKKILPEEQCAVKEAPSTTALHINKLLRLATDV